jgi:hypothetical protein
MTSGRSAELSELRLADVAAFLRGNGWTIERRDQKEVVWASPADDNGHKLRAALPPAETFADWRPRLASIVNMLAETSERPVVEIVRGIRSIARDIMFVSVGGPQASSGSISLGSASTMMAQHWDLLSYSACAEEDPQPYFDKARKIGKIQADKCFLGHTFHGSFGITIESPLPPQPKTVLFPPPAPIERRMVERIVRGLEDLDTSIVQGDLEPLVKNYKRGLNANMCSVLADVGQRFEGAPLSYRVAWSPNLKASVDVEAPRQWQITEKSLQYLESASHALRRAIETPGAMVIGKVTKLQSEEPPTMPAAIERAITILGLVPSGQRLHIRVALPPGEYMAACDAHKDGKEVSVVGTLEKDGKFWVLRAPADFRVLGRH